MSRNLGTPDNQTNQSNPLDLSTIAFKDNESFEDEKQEEQHQLDIYQGSETRPLSQVDLSGYTPEKKVIFKRLLQYCDHETMSLDKSFQASNFRSPNIGIYRCKQIFGRKLFFSSKGMTNYCLILTYVLAYFVYHQWILELQTLKVLQYPPLITIIISLCLQLRIMIMDPGLATMKPLTFKEPIGIHTAVRLYCTSCDLVAGDLITHCPFCECCVHKCDHHCGILGKCITKPNLTVFNAWVASVGFVFAAFMVALADVIFAVVLMTFIKPRLKHNTT